VRRQPIAVICVVAVIVVVLAVTALATPAEQNLKHWTNDARRNHGVPALDWRPRLHRIAVMQVHRMIACRCLTHLVSPPCRVWGQNVGLGVGIRSIFKGFMRSPEHRRNILDPAFDRGGLARRRAFGLAWVAIEFCG
jgi:uncharacterized protein YkwD